MIARLYRPLLIGLLPTILIACTNSGIFAADQGTAPPLGVDLGGSGPVSAAGAGEGHATYPQHRSEVQMAQANPNVAHGTGTVNSVDTSQRKINLSHQAISEIGWPAMTMEFPVAASVDLKTIKPGSRVNFTIDQAQVGMYEIQSITPAGGGQ